MTLPTRLQEALAVIEERPVAHNISLGIVWGNWRGECSCDWKGQPQYTNYVAAAQDALDHQCDKLGVARRKVALHEVVEMGHEV